MAERAGVALPDLAFLDETALYCPECAEREFGDQT
jgi:hypothetical protein